MVEVPLADVGERDRGRGAGDANHVVVFGQPIAAVAVPFGVTGEVAAVGEQLRTRRRLA